MVARMTAPPYLQLPTVPVNISDAPAIMTHEPMRESWIGFRPMRTRALLDSRKWYSAFQSEAHSHRQALTSR